MLYPIIILYACVVLIAEALRRMVKILASQSQARRLVKI